MDGASGGGQSLLNSGLEAAMALVKKAAGFGKVSKRVGIR